MRSRRCYSYRTGCSSAQQNNTVTGFFTVNLVTVIIYKVVVRRLLFVQPAHFAATATFPEAWLTQLLLLFSKCQDEDFDVDDRLLDYSETFTFIVKVILNTSVISPMIHQQHQSLLVVFAHFTSGTRTEKKLKTGHHVRVNQFCNTEKY